jgi:hypothetical protein
MVQALIPNDNCQRRQPDAGPGRVINTKTAQHFAARLSSCVGPGLRTLAKTGAVTPDLYAELAHLYDLRRPETERVLDALTRYAIRHQPESRRRGASRSGEGCV